MTNTEQFQRNSIHRENLRNFLQSETGQLIRAIIYERIATDPVLPSTVPAHGLLTEIYAMQNARRGGHNDIVSWIDFLAAVPREIQKQAEPFVYDHKNLESQNKAD